MRASGQRSLVASSLSCLRSSSAIRLRLLLGGSRSLGMCVTSLARSTTAALPRTPSRLRRGSQHSRFRRVTRAGSSTLRHAFRSGPRRPSGTTHRRGRPSGSSPAPNGSARSIGSTSRTSGCAFGSLAWTQTAMLARLRLARPCVFGRGTSSPMRGALRETFEALSVRCCGCLLRGPECLTRTSMCSTPRASSCPIVATTTSVRLGC